MQDYANQKKFATRQPSMEDIPREQPNSMQSKGPEIQFHFENTLHPNVPGPQWSYHTAGQSGYMYDQWGAPLNDSNYVPFPTQSAPTSVLYERARVVASSKSSSSSVRKAGQPSQRRPWTLEEENALMAGLDRVKGPHWSQILAMFGRGGTISEILKDRGQVQLKDKARNLKLFFLKNSIEVPYYLQFVTGELKTRAPAQAAKAEARSKAISEEDRARAEGILAFAAGPQQEHFFATPLGAQAGQAKQTRAGGSQRTEPANLDPNLSTLHQHLSTQGNNTEATVEGHQMPQPKPAKKDEHYPSPQATPAAGTPADSGQGQRQINSGMPL